MFDLRNNLKVKKLNWSLITLTVANSYTGLSSEKKQALRSGMNLFHHHR